MNKRATWKIFFRYMRHYRWITALLVFCTASVQVIEMFPPILYKQFFDTLSTASSRTASAPILSAILWKVLAAYGVVWLIWRAISFLTAYWQPKLMAEMTIGSYAYLLRHSYEFFSNSFSGSLLRKVQRLGRTFENITDKYLFNIIPLIVRIPAMMVVVYAFSPTIAFAILGWIILYLLCMYAFNRWVTKYNLEKADNDTKVTGLLADGITNSTTIKLFSGFKHEESLAFKAMEVLRKLRTLTWNLNMALESLQAALMIGFEVGVFFIAVHFWKAGTLTIGDFALIQYLVVNLFVRVWDFGRLFREMNEAYADADEMVTILNTPYSISDTPRAKKLQVKNGEIIFDHVNFSYRQTRKILNDFSLQIVHGEKVALVGPSGAGKSTVTKLLLRFYDPEEGKVFIDGQDVSKVTQESLRNTVSYVPQDPVLFHRTLLDNIRYAAPKATDAQVIKAAKLAHCHEFIQDFPEKYQTFVGERGVKLSGGERQRVAIARAILKNAPILILDEATSSLDSESEQLIQSALDRLMKNKTTIVIAHRLSTIMKMDRIVEMQDGQVTDIGTHNELISRKGGMYRKLWEIQAGGFEG